MGRKKKSPEPTEPPVAAPVPVAPSRPPRMLGRLALIVGFLVLVPWGISQLPNLTQRAEFQLNRDDIVLVPPPAEHVPADLLQRVLEKQKLPDQFALLDDELVGELAAAFEKNPWIAKVIRVRKSYPPRVMVEVEYRRPVAFIEVERGFYPVDANAVLLPPADFTPDDSRRFPIVRNVTTMPQGPSGTTWGDPLVLAAARLAESLFDRWEPLGLSSIVAPTRPDASISPGDLTFELTTKGGSKIVWGRPPGTSHPGELTVEQKIGRLERYLEQFGAFDGPHGPYEIDIRHWQEISRRPLTPVKSNAARPVRPRR
ncbi:MAG TPA: hypothetical protein VL132_05040 [Planctomycetaceae bacterium]|nr:hypothetical protein [Planctomycetaceae bacterium]